MTTTPKYGCRNSNQQTRCSHRRSHLRSSSPRLQEGTRDERLAWWVPFAENSNWHRERCGESTKPIPAWWTHASERKWISLINLPLHSFRDHRSKEWCSHCRLRCGTHTRQGNHELEGRWQSLNCLVDYVSSSDMLISFETGASFLR